MVRHCLAAAVVSTLMLLTACSGEGEPVDVTEDIPVITVTKEDFEAFANENQMDVSEQVSGMDNFAILAPSTMFMVLYGSSSCPPDPTAKATSMDEDEVIIQQVRLSAKYYDGACTADYAPHLYQMTLPEGYGLDKDLTVVLSYEQQEGRTYEVPVTPVPEPTAEPE